MARLDGAPGRTTVALGKGETVVVRGPAGIGKSTLVRRVLGDRNHHVGQSLEQLGDLPYHPLAHALGQAFEGPTADVAADVAAALAGDTLVIEDAHWSDGATLEVLALLAGHVPLVVTTRTPLAIERHDRVAVVDVPPLSPSAARALARKLHPTLDRSASSRLVELAGGSPLLLQQLVNGDAVSPTLVHAVRSRVTALPSVTIEQLAVVALHGRPLPRHLLAAAGAADVLEAGTALVREDTDGIGLAHALLADVVVDLVDDDTRQAIHTRLAEVCDAADAARHLLAAGQREAAADQAERAARTASPAEAAQLLALAVEARGHDAAVRLRLDAAAALIAVNQPTAADSIAAGVEAATSTERAEAGWYRSQAAWLQGDEQAAERHCDEALVLVKGSGAPIETHLLLERVSQRVRVRLGDATVIDDADEAWSAAERAGVDQSRARSLVGLALSHNGRPGWAEHFEAAAAIAREAGDVEQELTAMYWLISAYGFYGPLRAALELGPGLIEESERHGLRRLHHHFLGAHLVQVFGTGTATDEHVVLARGLLAERSAVPQPCPGRSRPRHRPRRPR